MAKKRLRFPAADTAGNRVGTVVLRYEGELPKTLNVRFVESKGNSWLEREPEEEPPPDEPQEPDLGYAVLKRPWCGQPFTFLGTEQTEEPPRELLMAAKHYTRSGLGRIVVIGAWDGRFVVPMYDAMQGAAHVFLVDPVCPGRLDADTAVVPPAQVIQALEENVRRNSPPDVVLYTSVTGAVNTALGLSECEDVDLIVIAADMNWGDAVNIAQAWKQHLRPGGKSCLMGITAKQRVKDIGVYQQVFAECNLTIGWNADGTVWRAVPTTNDP